MRSSSPTRTGRTTTAAKTPIASPTAHTGGGERRDGHRHTEQAEGRHLGHARQGGVEADDFGLVWRPGVADDDARDEDGEEARAVQDRSEAENHPATSRVRIGYSAAVGSGTRRMRGTARAAEEPDCRADDHLEGELPCPGTDGGQAGGRRSAAVRTGGGEQGRHRRDADRVVGAGLALEDRPDRPAISLRPRTEKTTAGSVGESHPSSRGGQPVEPEEQVGDRGHTEGGDERAEDPSQMIAPLDWRNRRQPMHAAVEEQHDEHDRDDSLHREDPHRADGGDGLGEQRAADEEERGAGTLSRSLSRFAQTAARPARLTSRTSAA